MSYAWTAWDYIYNNRLANGIKWVIGGLWNGIVWFFTTTEEMQNNNLVGHDFKIEFTTKIQENHPDQTIDIKFYEKSFNELLMRSRRQKKPIVVLMMRDNSNESYNFVVNALQDQTV